MSLERKLLSVVSTLLLGAFAASAQSLSCEAVRQETLERAKDVRIAMFGEVHPEFIQGALVRKNDEDNQYFISLISSLKNEGYTAVGVELPNIIKPYLDLYMQGRAVIRSFENEPLKSVIGSAMSYDLDVLPLVGPAAWDGNTKNDGYDQYMRLREQEMAGLVDDYMSSHPDSKIAIFVGAEHINKRANRMDFYWDARRKEGIVIHGPTQSLFVPVAAELSRRYPVLSVDLTGGILERDIRNVTVDITVPRPCVWGR